jgi:hypothetical protein
MNKAQKKQKQTNGAKPDDSIHTFFTQQRIFINISKWKVLHTLH